MLKPRNESFKISRFFLTGSKSKEEIKKFNSNEVLSS